MKCTVVRGLFQPSRGLRKKGESLSLFHFCLLPFGLCLALAPWLPPGALHADDATSRYFEELRRRRLFVLAEGYCVDRLRQERLAPETRAELTLELSRTFAEHAKFTTGEEQAAYWKQASRTIDDFLKDNPRNPQRLRLEVQGALIPAAHGEFLRWQSELFPDSTQRRQQAVTVLDVAISRLKGLEVTLAERIRGQREAAQNERLRIGQLQQMWSNVRYRLAVSLLDLAKLLPSDSPDRASHLLDAWDILRQLAGGLPDETMTWHSQVLLAECSRMRGEPDQASDLLDKISEDKPPKDVADRVVAEKVRVLLAQHKPADAARMLLDYSKQSGLSGELHFLNTRVLIALWEIAEEHREHDTAAALLGQIERRVDRANREIGGYWGHRCRLLLESVQEERRYGVDLAPLVRKARTLYAEGHVDEAVEQYGEATRAADRAGKPQLAMELGYTRASIQLKSKRYQQAADDFRALTERFPAEQQAAGAHLLLAYCLGKLYDDERSEQGRRTYAEALAAHREKFADDPTNVEATWLLARLEEAEGQVTRALELYHEIPAEDRHGPQAQVGVARCYERVLEILREQKQPTDDWEQTAIERLRQIVASFPGEPTTLTLEQAEVMLRLSRIFLSRLPPESATADRLLERVFSTWQRLAASGGPTDKTLVAAWKPLLKTAAQLRIIALAGQPDPGPQQAASLIRGLSASNTDEVLGVLDGLMQLAKYTDDATRRSLGELQLQAALALNQRRPEMNDAAQNRLDHCLAQAYVATAQPRRAVAVYERLVEQSPRDKRLRRTLADLLMQGGTDEFLKKAQSNWRKLEKLEEAGSPQWLDARYHLARCTLELGDYAGCRKLLGVTKLLYPDLGGGELQARFASLEGKLRDKPRK